jgi:tRNA(Met) cytidine acetyltransferase
LFISKQALIDTDNEHKVIQNKHYKQYLGYEFSCVIYNAFDGLKPSAVLGLEGTVQKGGLFIIVCPELQHWPEYEAQTPGIQFSYREKHTHSAFIQRFLKQVQLDKSSAIYAKNSKECKLPYCKAIDNVKSAPVEQEKVSGACVLTPHQQKTKRDHLKALQDNTSVSVITAKRGRGKSTLLAQIAADFCLANAHSEIYITAQHRYNCERAINEFSAYISQNAEHSGANDGNLASTKITYVPIDRLTSLNKQACLLIDEAASLPPELLLDVCAHFDKVIMASTQVGYEGSGLGFTLRVLPALAKEEYACITSQLSSPIRWYESDVLEASFEQAFAPSINFNQNIKGTLNKVQNKADNLNEGLQTLRLSKQDLINNKELLLSVFSILLQSHYQTTPDDLMRMLDANDQLVFLTVLKAEQSENMPIEALAAALVQVEGGLPHKESALINQIASGERRVPGHLVAQNLCTSYSIETFMSQVSWRISRIAVRHQLKGYGIGTYLLNHLEQKAREDSSINSLQTSFGVTSELVNFWYKNDFQFVKAGMRVDTSSGKHSIIMTKPLTKGYEMQLRALLELRVLQLQLIDIENEPAIEFIRDKLEAELSGSLLVDDSLPVDGSLPVDDSLPVKNSSKAIIQRQLHDFVEGKRSFNLSMPAIYSANMLLLRADITSSEQATLQNTIEISMETLFCLLAGHMPKQEKGLTLEAMRETCKQLLTFLK